MANVRGGLEDSGDLCDPDDPEISLGPRYDLEVSGFLEFARGYRIFRGLDRTGVILRGITWEQVGEW